MEHETVTARLGRIAADVWLVLRDWPGIAGPPPVRLGLMVDGCPAPPPTAVTRLSLTDGGIRAIAALRRPDPAAPTVALRDGDGALHGQVTVRNATLPRWDGAALVEGLDAAGRARLADFLLSFCAKQLRLGGEREFAALCHSVFAAFGTVVELRPQLALGAGHMVCAGVCSGPLPAAGTGPVAVHLVSEDRVASLPFPPLLPAPAATAPADRRIWTMVPRAPSAVRRFPPFLVVTTAGGPRVCAIRDDGATLPGVLSVGKAWLAAPNRPLHSYLLSCLGLLSERPDVAAVMRELQVLWPQPAATLGGAGKPLAGALEVAIGHGAGGLFLAGWLKDPYRLVERIEVTSGFGERRCIDEPLDRFAIPNGAAGAVPLPHGVGVTDIHPGFAAYLPGFPGQGPVLQHRLELQLSSGERVDLVGPLQPPDFAAARAAVLGCVMPQALTSGLLERCIAPPAAALHAQHLATRRPVDVVQFGTPPAGPAVSVIVPLYRNLEFLNFQFAAFATDSTLAAADIVYVLDSPEQRAEVEQLLYGLHTLYGMPLRLAVQRANYGYGPACNAGAALAWSDVLLFLNSDVLPDRPGWLAVLRAALSARPRVAALGPKLLFDDDSLQHAGLCFGQDARGRWHNQHYYKGFPRDYPPANLVRPVPGVTGACLMIRRPVFEGVGGFTEDYIIGDYEDSDLCLKVRSAGHDILYVPTAELYHLERQSIQHHAGYTRSLASTYNGWLHGRRWGGLMADLMATDARRGRVSAARGGRVVKPAVLSAATTPLAVAAE